MKSIPIKCNTRGLINIDNFAIANGISIVLLNEKQTPIARYEFNCERLSKLTTIMYDANNARIHFYSDIIPTMIYEINNFDI